MRTMVFSLVLVIACGAEPARVEIGGQSCVAVALAVLGPVLPDWDVHAIVVDRVGGDAGWALASDEVGALMLKRWPEGAALALSQFGGPDDFSLLPGRGDDESWLLLDRADGPQVWRLAPDGTATQAPAPGAFAGPGAWTYGLLLAEDSVLLLAATRGVPSSDLRFGFARLDPGTLVASSLGPNLHFSELCHPIDEIPCSVFGKTPELIEVDIEAVTEPGTMPGAAALLSVDFGPRVSPGFLTLQAIDHQDERPGEVLVRMPGLIPCPSGANFTGAIASDGEFLYAAFAMVLFDEHTLLPAGSAYAPLGERRSDVQYHLPFEWSIGDSVLQLGAHTFLTRDGYDGFEVARAQGDSLGPVLAIELPSDAEVRSAGREQWFARPLDGPALRIGARCE